MGDEIPASVEILMYSLCAFEMAHHYTDTG